jgi:hypothetical protein
MLEMTGFGQARSPRKILVLVLVLEPGRLQGSVDHYFVSLLRHKPCALKIFYLKHASLNVSAFQFSLLTSPFS